MRANRLTYWNSVGISIEFSSMMKESDLEAAERNKGSKGIPRSEGTGRKFRFKKSFSFFPEAFSWRHTPAPKYIYLGFVWNSLALRKDLCPCDVFGKHSPLRKINKTLKTFSQKSNWFQCEQQNRARSLKKKYWNLIKISITKIVFIIFVGRRNKFSLKEDFDDGNFLPILKRGFS